MESVGFYGRYMHRNFLRKEQAKKDRPKAVVFLRESSQAFFCKACILAITC